MSRPLLFIALIASACHSDPVESDAPICPKGTDPTFDGGRDYTANPAVVTVKGATEIDALSDVHGDPDALVRLLVVGGLISASTPCTWTGGTRVLVVTGDTIDKGSYALRAIDLFIALEAQARAAGGRVVVTLGNHEAEFMADPNNSKATEFRTELAIAGLDPSRVAAGDSRYGAWLRSRPIAAVVDEWFFAHAGNPQSHTVDQINQRVISAPNFGDPFFVGADSLLEARLWWSGSGGSVATLDKDLSALGVRHIVFGHVPTDISFPDDPQGDRAKGTIAARYSGRIFMIDTGMSYAVNDSSGAFLKIVRGAPTPTIATAVHSDGSSVVVWTGQ